MVGCNSVCRHCRAGRVFGVCCIPDDREKYASQPGRLRGCGNACGRSNRAICLWSSVRTSGGGSFFVSGRGITAAGIVGVILLPPVAAFVLLPLVGIVLQGSSTITYGSVSQFVDEARQSRGFALIYSMANGASVAGPVGFGMISDLYSVGTAVAIMAVVTLLPLAMCGRLQAGLNRVGQ